MGCGVSMAVSVLPEPYDHDRNSNSTGGTLVHVPPVSPADGGEIGDARLDRRPENEDEGIGELMSITELTAPEVSALRTFTALDIHEHNTAVGWCEWLPYRGLLYDGRGCRDYFQQYLSLAGGDLEPSCAFWFSELQLLEEPDGGWSHPAVFVARCYGVPEEEIARALPQFLVGRIVHASGEAYWSSMRHDVDLLQLDLEERERELSEGEEDYLLERELSEAEKDYLEQLRRWQEKFASQQDQRNETQLSSFENQVPNEKVFPLPVHPDSLRLWLQDESTPFDTEVPEEGAWVAAAEDETEKLDIGDPNETWACMLRHYLYDGSAPDMEHGAPGEAAWEMLPADVVKEDVVTARQQEVLAARAGRSDLQDPVRMARRRQRLARYFVHMYQMDPADLSPYLQWARVMEQNAAELEQLCVNTA